MKTQKQLLAEIINDIKKALIMDQVNQKYTEQRAEKMNDRESFEYQKQKAEFEMTINARVSQLEILQEMYKKQE